MIAPQPFFTPRGTPLSVYYRLLTLAELGHTVDLLTYPAGRDVAIHGVTILRPPVVPRVKSVKAGPSLVKLLFDAVLFPLALIRLARNPGRYHALFVHEEAVAVGLVAKKIFGLPLIYDMHASLPAQFEAFDYANLRVVKEIFDRLEKASLARADCVLTICPDLDRRVRQAGCAKTVLLPNSRLGAVPETSGDSDDLPRFISAATFMQKKVGETLLFYCGTLEPYQGIDLMLHAFAIVAAKHNGAKLLLVGGTEGQVEKAKTKRHDLNRSGRLLFAGTLSPGRTAALMHQADVLLSTRTRGTNTPLKIYAYMASGIPIVATNIHSHTQELGPGQAFLVDPSAEAVAEAVLQCIGNRALARQKAGNARALYERRYSAARYREKLKKALASMNQGG